MGVGLLPPGEARERSRGSDLGVVLPILVVLESLLASSPPPSEGICQGPDSAYPFLTECSVGSACLKRRGGDKGV